MAKKQEEKDVFWWIFNQEEMAVGIAFAKTAGGALSRFEIASGLDRDSYRAEKVSFSYNCALSSGFPIG
jgi:hypothetical protein